MSDVLQRLHARALGAALLLRARRSFRYSPEAEPFAPSPGPTGPSTTSVMPSVQAPPSIRTVSEAATTAAAPVEGRQAPAPEAPERRAWIARAETQLADYLGDQAGLTEPPAGRPAERSRRRHAPAPAIAPREEVVGSHPDSVAARRDGPADPQATRASLETPNGETTPASVTRSRPAPATRRGARQPSAITATAASEPRSPAPPPIIRQRTNPDLHPLDASASADPTASPPSGPLPRQTPSRLITTPSAPSFVRPESAPPNPRDPPRAAAPEADTQARHAATTSAPTRRVDDGPAHLATPSKPVTQHQPAPRFQQPPPRSRSPVHAASSEGSSPGGEDVARRASRASPARLLGDRRSDQGPLPPDTASPVRRPTAPTPTPAGPASTAPNTVARRLAQAAPIEDRVPAPANGKAGDRGPPSLFRSRRADRGERPDGDSPSASRPSPPRGGDSATATTDVPRRRGATATVDREAATGASRQALAREPRAARDATDQARPSSSPLAEPAGAASINAAPPAPSRATASDADGPEAAFRPRETARPKSPDVRIDIGRIEVNLPAPPRAIVRQRAQPPPLSLKPRRTPEP